MSNCEPQGTTQALLGRSLDRVTQCAESMVFRVISMLASWQR